MCAWSGAVDGGEEGGDGVFVPTENWDMKESTVRARPSSQQPNTDPEPKTNTEGNIPVHEYPGRGFVIDWSGRDGVTSESETERVPMLALLAWHCIGAARRRGFGAGGHLAGTWRIPSSRAPGLQGSRAPGRPLQGHPVARSSPCSALCALHCTLRSAPPPVASQST